MAPVPGLEPQSSSVYKVSRNRLSIPDSKRIIDVLDIPEREPFSS